MTRSLFAPEAHYRSQPPARVWILEFGRNPSTDYYVVPRCAASARLPRELIDVTRIDPASLDIPPGTFVIIVRYATGTWLRYLLANQSRLAGAVYFMDDDLPTAFSSPHLPGRYRYKIFRYFLLQRRALSKLCSEVWVSTRYLADKYHIDSRYVLEPLPLMRDERAATQTTYFYEGTASHLPEFRWVLEVVSQVQTNTDDLTFITVGNHEVRRMFAGIPRTLCLHPVNWETYRRSFSVVRHDIGLVPLTDSSFNRGRSHTKFFDMTRLGAVGIYSNVLPYSEFVQSGVDGLLVPNDPAEWSAAIVELSCSEEKRSRLLSHARVRVDRLRQEAHGFPGPSLSERQGRDWC